MLYTELKKFIVYYKRNRLHTLEDYERILDFFLDTFTKIPHNSKDITIDPFIGHRNGTLYFNAWTRKLLFMIKRIIRFCIKRRKFINILLLIAWVSFLVTYTPCFVYEYFFSFPKLKGFLLDGKELFDDSHYHRYVHIFLFSCFFLKSARVVFLLLKYYMNNRLGISDEEILDNLANNVCEEEKLRNGFIFFCCYVLIPWFFFLRITCNPPLDIYIAFILLYFDIMLFISLYFIIWGRLTIEQQYLYTKRGSVFEDHKNNSITYIIFVFHVFNVIISFERGGGYILEFFLHMLVLIFSL